MYKVSTETSQIFIISLLFKCLSHINPKKEKEARLTGFSRANVLAADETPSQGEEERAARAYLLPLSEAYLPYVASQTQNPIIAF